MILPAPHRYFAVVLDLTQTEARMGRAADHFPHAFCISILAAERRRVTMAAATLENLAKLLAKVITGQERTMRLSAEELAADQHRVEFF
jgi:hypothetical protein